MHPSLSLHTASRAYCMDQHSEWCRVYAKVHKDRKVSGYTDGAKSVYPRYNVLAAILLGVEQVDADRLPDVETLRKLLLVKGQSSETLFTKGPQGEIESRAMAEEREKFCAFVRDFDPSSQKVDGVLLYRRGLLPDETKELWSKIERRWGANGGYWYPLAERSDPSLFAFHIPGFDANAAPEQLRAILRNRGVSRVFELREYGDENYHLDGEGWEPNYSGAEGFWVSEELDWILYASHEGSMTTGGWLTDEVFNIWPAGREQPWSFVMGT